MSKLAQTASQSKKQTTNPVDERLRQISRDILPSAPYQLKIDVEIRRDQSQAIEWRRSCPFEPHEERLQYITFRSDLDKDTIFRVEGNWDDDNGNIMKKTGNLSGLSTPLPGQPPKKKITLSDYKNKAAGHGSTIKTSSKADGEGKALGLANGAGALLHAPKSSTNAPLHNLKRPLDAELGSEHTSSPHPPPPKKVRLPSDSTPAAGPTETEQNPVWQLPPMLSSMFPPDLEEELAKFSAAELSKGHSNTNPTTKSLVEKTNLLIASSTKDNPQNAKVKSKELAQPTDRREKTSPSLKATKINQERQQKSTSIQRISSAATKGDAGAKSPKLGNSVEEKKAVSAATSVTSPQKPEKKSLVAKLRIPKPIRKNCMRILQMQPRPFRRIEQDKRKADDKKAPVGKPRDRPLTETTGENAESRSELAKGSTPSVNGNGRKLKPPEDVSTTPRSGEKRKKQYDQGTTSEPMTKRQKQPSGLDLSEKPHTPVKPPLRSPLVSQHSSAHNPQLSTPKRELKGTAMHRIGSSEGDVKTPLGAARGGTPSVNGASERVNRDGRSSSNTSGGIAAVRHEDITAWRAEQKKFEALGRTLKHEAKAALPKDGDFKDDTPTMRQGAAVAFEAILAFMLAFAIGEEVSRLNRQPAEPTAWRSLLPYLHYVQRVTRIYPPLLGLTHQLEAVCRDLLLLCDAERLDRDVFLASALDDQRPSNSDSSGPNVSPSAVERAKHDFADFRTKHIDNMRQAPVVWQLGYSELSIREMQRSFPSTWGKRADLPGPGKGKEKLSPKTYADGPYYLPFGPTTSGIEGVRAGWQMLGEWCGRNEVKWQGKMGL